MLKLLFISNVMDKKSYEKLYNDRTIRRIEPSQKFFDLFVNGIVDNDIDMTCISIKPIYYAIYKKLFIKKEFVEINDKLKYYYLDFINYPLFKQISIYCNIKKVIKKWIKENKNSEKVIVVDPMLVEATNMTIKIAKKYNVKVVSFVTDVPCLTFSVSGKLKFLKKYYLDISNRDLEKFDAHILLTDEMNTLFNKDNKPNLLIESIVPYDIDKKTYDNSDERIKTFIVMYAGKLHEKFGAKNLVDAMALIQNKDIEMWIYGDGDSVEYIKDKSLKDTRIKYFGVVPVQEIENTIRKVSLLINPRPVSNEFTKYSFPSKTVEYMMSNTPFASTKLEGIPKEYFDYIIPIENDNSEGIADEILSIYKNDYDDYIQKAKRAKEYVLEKKNNIVQGEKIYKFLLKVCK